MNHHAVKSAAHEAKGVQPSQRARASIAGSCPHCAEASPGAYRDDLRFGLHDPGGSGAGALPLAGKPPAGGWVTDVFDAVGEAASEVGTAIGQGVAAVAAALTPPKLSKSTVTPATPTDCGGYKWGVQWKLDKKSPLGGWVVQKVEMPHNVKDCDGKAQDPGKLGGFDPAWTPYWEAWQINKNQDVTTYAEGGDVFDDTYMAPALGKGTQGDFTIKGTAEFYEGLKLPAGFTVKNAPPAGILPHTTTAPALAGGTGSIPHSLKVAWDCCTKGAKADTTLTTT